MPYTMCNRNRHLLITPHRYPNRWGFFIYRNDMDIDTETIAEIDEALAHAIASRKTTIDSKKHLVNKFIDDLLDSRLELSQWLWLAFQSVMYAPR